jgi:hypothetical protein
MFADEHVNIAAHEHYHGNDDSAEHEPNARHDIHGRLQRVRNIRLSWTVAQPSGAAHQEPYARAIKDT